MLKLTNDHWKKIAEDEYYAASNEKAKEQTEQTNQFEWDRRFREGKWLLKGVKKVEDKKMVNLLDEKVARDNRGKYIPEEEIKKKKRYEEENRKSGGDVRKKKKRTIVNIVQDWMKPKEKVKTVSRVRNARFVIKEGIAKLLVHRDVVNERDKFLKDNSNQIRLIQNVRLLLNRPKLPPHHKVVTAMVDSEPPMSAEVACKKY